MMKRVNTVLAANRAVISSIMGATRDIHGVAQGAPGMKMFCMSTQRWIARGVIGSRISLPILFNQKPDQMAGLYP